MSNGAHTIGTAAKLGAGLISGALGAVFRVRRLGRRARGSGKEQGKMPKVNHYRTLAVVAVAALLLAFALVSGIRPTEAASSLNNGGFETGTLSGWTTNTDSGGSVNAVQSYDTGKPSFESYAPKEGSYFALLNPGSQGVYALVSQPFSAAPGDKIGGWAFFDANDYTPFNDDAQVLIKGSDGTVVATPFDKSVSAVGDYGKTPWTQWEHTFAESGTYTIVARVANQEDGYSGYSSAIGLDDVSTQTANTPPVAADQTVTDANDTESG